MDQQVVLKELETLGSAQTRKQMDEATIKAWVHDCGNHVITDALVSRRVDRGQGRADWPGRLALAGAVSPK